MDNKELKPKIRFNHFSEKWQQVYLGDYAKYRRGSFPQPYGKSEWYDGVGAMPFVQVVDVGEDMKLVDDTKQKISVIAQPMSVMASKGQVIVTLQGSIGRVAILQYDAYIDRTILLFEEYNDKVDAEFWGYLIKNKFEEEAKKAPGGIIKTITKDTLSDFDLLVTDYFEQQLIGDFFENIDNLIKQSKEKVEKWKNIRTSFLSKMFPKPGSCVPELRLKGFSGEWEYKYLGEIFDYEQPGNYIVKSQEYDDNGKTPVLTAGQTFILGFTNENFGIKKADKENPVLIFDDFMTTLHYVDFNFKVKSSALKILDIKNKELDDIYFNTLLLCNINYKVQTHERHWISKFMPMKILTTTIEEQKEIGNFFKNLDFNIKLQQLKLDKLKQIKQSFLSKMFV